MRGENGNDVPRSNRFGNIAQSPKGSVAVEVARPWAQRRGAAARMRSGRLHRIDKGAQGRGEVSSPGVIEVVGRQMRPPVFQDTHKRATGHVGRGLALDSAEAMPNPSSAPASSISISLVTKTPGASSDSVSPARSKVQRWIERAEG